MYSIQILAFEDMLIFPPTRWIVRRKMKLFLDPLQKLAKIKAADKLFWTLVFQQEWKRNIQFSDQCFRPSLKESMPYNRTISKSPPPKSERAIRLTIEMVIRTQCGGQTKIFWHSTFSHFLLYFIFIRYEVRSLLFSLNTKPFEEIQDFLDVVWICTRKF